MVQRCAAGLAPAELRMVFADWASLGQMLLRQHEELLGSLPGPDHATAAAVAAPAESTPLP